MTSRAPTATNGTAVEASVPPSSCTGAVATGVVTGDGSMLTVATGETVAGDDAGLGVAETAATGLGVGVGVGVDTGEGGGDGRTDGARVGVGVGRGVGRGVARGVGLGVGRGVAAAGSTLIVPFIWREAWISQ